MAIPAALTTGFVSQLYGIRVPLLSTDPTVGLELQFATAANAPTSKWVSHGRFSPHAAQGGSFIIARPHTTQLTYFRARAWKVGYPDSAFTTVVSGRPQLLTQLLPPPITGAIQVGISTPHNNQGSLLPIAVPGPGNQLLTFNKYANSNAASAQLVWSWAAFTLYRPDGTTISVPANTSMISNPPSPVLGQQAGGALGARTYFVRISYIKNGRLYGVSAEASLAVNANNLLTIAAPAQLAGMDGWAAHISTTTNTEIVNASFLWTGGPYSEPVGGATTTGGVKYQTTWANAIIDAGPSVGVPNGLTDGSTVYPYPFYDMLSGFIAFPTLTTPTALDGPSAQQANQDGRIPLAPGGFAIVLPAANGSGSGTGGGGNKL